MERRLKGLIVVFKISLKMLRLNDLVFTYSDVNIKIIFDEDRNNITNIQYTYEQNDRVVNHSWENFSTYLLHPKNNLLESIFSRLRQLPIEEYELLSSTSVASLSNPESTVNPDTDEYLLKNCLRGIAVVTVLSSLIARYRYIKCQAIPNDLNIFTINGLKVLRMGIILHLKCINSDNKLLKHGLDFVNRWSGLFIKGDGIDKTEILVELIANYLCKSSKNANEKSFFEDRINRIENILGIH